jgi:DNA-binding NarL/FixJ family response regulator
MQQTSVFIADDHTLMREGLRSLLAAQTHISVVGVAENGFEAVRGVLRLKPQMVLMDISMPGLNGLEATRQIADRCPECKVIILSMHATIEHYHQAIRAGASGYLLKESATEEIVQAVRCVGLGRRYISNSLIARFEYQPNVESPLDGLSRREREILQLVAENHCSASIAKILNISPKSVDTYRSRLMRKLGLRGTPDLVKLAIRHGLTSIQ